MNAIGKQVESNSFFIRPVVAFIGQHVNAATDECLLTQLYAETRRVRKEEVSLPPSRLSLEAAKKSQKNPKCESSKNRRRREENAHCDGQDQRKH